MVGGRYTGGEAVGKRDEPDKRTWDRADKYTPEPHSHLLHVGWLNRAAVKKLTCNLSGLLKHAREPRISCLVRCGEWNGVWSGDEWNLSMRCAPRLPWLLFDRILTDRSPHGTVPSTGKGSSDESPDEEVATALVRTRPPTVSRLTSSVFGS